MPYVPLTEDDSYDMESNVPAEWEDVVHSLKGKVDNPWAVTHSMINKGYKRHSESGKPYDPDALFRRHLHECGMHESIGGGALGALFRKGAMPFPKMKEAAVVNKDPGKGKLSDKTRSEIGTVGSKKREEQPSHVFLKPDERKYPVKRNVNGKWKYDGKLLLAAERRARMNQDPVVAAHARELRKKLTEAGWLREGDSPGHPFRGNQYTTGQGGGGEKPGGGYTGDDKSFGERPYFGKGGHGGYSRQTIAARELKDRQAPADAWTPEGVDDDPMGDVKEPAYQAEREPDDPYKHYGAADSWNNLKPKERQALVKNLKAKGRDDALRKLEKTFITDKPTAIRTVSNPHNPELWPERKRESATPARIKESEKPQTVTARWFVPLREAGMQNGDGAQVILMTEGAGNSRDGNYYTADCVRSAARVFEGAKCFINHPTESEEEDRPERDARDMCGWFSDVRPEKVGGRQALMAKLNFGSSTAAKEAKSLIKDAIRFQQQYPSDDKVYCGFSINAAGPSRIDAVDGAPRKVVESIDWAMSADLVTFPARGGKALALREAEQEMESRFWFDALREACRRGRRDDADRLLLDRVKEAMQAPTDFGMVGQVGRGLQEYQGAIDKGRIKLTDDRAGMLEDLNHKADAVESDHNPATIANLLSALRAFLGEEIKEASDVEEERAEKAKEKDAEEERKMAFGDKKGEENQTDEAPEEVQKSEEEKKVPGEGDDNDADDAMESKKEAEPTAGKPAAMLCEACGHEMKTGLVESERAELMQFRMADRRDRKLTKAATRIREAGVVGLISPKELAAFSEDQWPTVIGLSEGRPRAALMPESNFGDRLMESDQEPTKRPGSASAIDVFERSYARGN